MLLSSSLSLSDGVLTIFASETIDSTPASLKVDLTKFFLADVSGDEAVPLAGATVIEQDETSLTITLTEPQRAAAVAISGTRGGDGGSIILEMEPAACQDTATNVNDAQGNITVVETPDEIAPSIISVSLDYNTGTLEIICDETVDANPSSLVNLNRLHIANISNDSAS